jgi:hypothetical protein
MSKYWEIVGDNLRKAGWSLGWVSAIDSNGRTYRTKVLDVLFVTLSETPSPIPFDQVFERSIKFA